MAQGRKAKKAPIEDVSELGRPPGCAALAKGGFMGYLTTAPPSILELSERRLHMKPEFAKYLSTDSILALEGETKKDILDEIIKFAAVKCALDEDHLRESVWKREKMMTTGVGHGLALPHIRLSSFPEPLVVIGLCKRPIADYKSLDNEPIRLVVFIAADESDQEAYLKLLGSVSYKLKDEKVIAEIVDVMKNKRKVYGILSKE